LQVAIRTSVLADQTGMQTLFLKIHNSLVTAADANERTASTLMILGRYIVLLFFPYPLSCDYSYNEIALVRWNSPWAYLSLLVYAGLFFVIVKRFRKKEAWVFGIIYYLATMVLYSNILFPVGATLGERFLYIPSFGFCIVIVTGLMKLFPGSAGNNMKSIAAGLRQAALPSAVIFIVSVILVIKTIDRNDDWQNNMELFGADVKKNPNSAPLNYLYGNEILQQRALLQQDSLLKRKMMDTVITYFNKAITIYPEYGDAYSQRALAYFRTDRYDQSAEDYKRSIYDYKVGAWEDYNNMGVIYFRRNIHDSALKFFSWAISVEGTQAVPFKNLGASYQVKGDYKKAIGAYEKSLELQKGLDDFTRKDIYQYLADCYMMVGDNNKSNQYRSLVK
jgi:tetratricopeptide (TPR) repeat protein